MNKFVFIFIAQFIFSPLLYAGDSLSDFENKYECKIIEKGFNEEDIVKLDTKDYVIAWCDKNPNKKRAEYTYNLIIFYKNKKHDFASCPNFIEISRMTVLSLLGEKKPVIIYEDEGIATLDKFWNVESNPTNLLKNLKGVRATGTGLHIGWWDAGQIIYCHDGKWISSGYH